MATVRIEHEGRRHFGSEEQCQRWAREQGLRGVCLICRKAVTMEDTFALVFESCREDACLGPTHEECLSLWQKKG